MISRCRAATAHRLTRASATPSAKVSRRSKASIAIVKGALSSAPAGRRRLLRAARITGRLPQGIGIEQLAVHYDQTGLAQIPDTRGRIALDERQVGSLADLDRAGVLVHAAKPGRRDGRP